VVGTHLTADDQDSNDDRCCLECGEELCGIDDDPNGERNLVCARCRAEQDHDFDREPNAVFDRSGDRVDDRLTASKIQAGGFFRNPDTNMIYMRLQPSGLARLRLNQELVYGVGVHGHMAVISPGMSVIRATVKEFIGQLAEK